MVDTARSIAQILALLADNTTGNISPQDMRDVVETLQLNYGGLHVEPPAVTTVSDTTSYFDLTGTWNLGPARNFDQSAANGRLTYVGTPVINVVLFCVASLTTAGPNNVIHLRLEKNGADIEASDSTQKLATGADVATLVALGFESLTTGDYITAAVRNETSTDNITAENAHLIAVGMAV